MRVALAALILAVAWPSAAQPRLTGAQVNERPFTESIEAALRQPGGASDAPASWLAWAVPVADGRSTMCCYSGWNDGSRSGGTCRLEPGSSSTVMTRDGNRALRLEPAETFFVFVRIQNRQVERVRMFSEDCEVEAQGTAVTWLTSVPPAASVAFLEGVAGEADVTARASKGALAALAQHAAAESTTALVRLARRAPDSDLRGDALFWLSQRAGERAVGAITEAIEHDPETQVKKKAVFALSQLPAGEGVPKLIEVARTNRNPAVRKQAMFWLGQSKDPRALTFFEQILK